MLTLLKIYLLLIFCEIWIDQAKADCYLHETTINCDDATEEEVRTFCENLQDDYNAILLDYPLFTNLNSQFLPANVTEKFVQFAIASGEIQVIDSDAFQGYTNLQKVDLEYLSVNRLPTRLFDNVGQLENIFLESIALPNVDSFVFANSATLKSVVIAYSDFTSLGPNTFVNLQSFEKLQITGNLNSLDSNMFANTPAFKSLQLQRNSFAEVPAQFLLGAPSTTEINLSGNIIHRIDEDAFNGLKLNKLILDHNRLDDMPDLVGVQIKSVSIVDNTLSALDWIHNLKKLEVLSVADNHLGNLLPEIFATTPLLHTLNISGNLLKSLNITILAQYLPKLSIHLAANPWDCSILPVMLEEANETSITIDWGKLDYSKTNVNGIRCFNYN